MPITKPDMEFIWASGGAIVEPSDTKKQTGWTAEVPPHQWENWIQNRQDNYLAHVNERGIAEWDGNTNYLAAGLSYVQGSNGIVYKSVAASGPATTIQDPTTDVTDTYWTVAFADVGAFLTQASGDARYLQQTNNLSDLNNTATARTNLGVQNAVEAGIQGAFSNLKLSATGLSALVTITADSVCVKNASNFQVVLNSVSVTPSLAASGANGLDTGVSAASTWYSVWVIWNGTTTAGLLSLSSTSPTMPVGYTHKARIGWVRSDSTANKFPLSCTQFGRSARYKVASGTNMLALPFMISGVQGNTATPTWVAASSANFIPTTAGAISVLLHIGNSTAMVAPSNAYGSATSTVNPPPLVASAAAGTFNLQGVFNVESPNIYFASDAAPGFVQCAGWEDNI